jgi:tetratricopeptide (TPR) repeat protein
VIRTEATPVRTAAEPVQPVPAGQRRYTVGPNHDYYNVGAFLAYGRGDYEEALEQAGEGLRDSPNHPYFYWVRGNVYQAREEYDRALTELGLAIAAEPTYSSAYVTRAEVYVKLQKQRDLTERPMGGPDDWDRALADLNKAIEVDPNEEMAYHHRAYIYTYTLEYDKAWDDVKAYERISGEALDEPWFSELKRCSDRTE